MPYLPNLIKKIDNYCRLADALALLKRAAPMQWTMPDDPETDEEEETRTDLSGPGLYPKIISIAGEFINKDIADEILLIAELYKKSIEMGTGFNQVNRALSVALSNMDSLIDDGTTSEEEVESAEDILNEISKDLRQRAKTTPPSTMSENTIMKELKAVRDAFNQHAIYEEVAAQPSVYEKGKPGAEVGHIVGPKPALETPRKYELEIARLEDSLENDPSISLNVPPSERSANQNIRENILELIKVLKQLSQQLPIVAELESAVKLAPDDDKKKEELIREVQVLESLRQKRKTYKSRTNKFSQTKELTTLEKQMETSRNPAEKKWLQERIDLQKVRLSNDYRRRAEISARKKLISSLGKEDDRGDFQALTPSADLENKLREAVEQGRAQRKDKVEYDRKQTIERGTEHGKKGPVPERQKGRVGGGRIGEKLHNYELDSATFSGLVDKLNEKINTSAHVARLNITQIVVDKKKTHNELKPFVDRVSKAIQKKDNAAKLVAIKELKAQMKVRMDKAPAIKALARNIRWLPFFQRVKVDLETIAGWNIDADKNFDENKTALIQKAMLGGRKVIDAYRKYYPETETKRPNQLEISFDGTVRYLDDVLDQLSIRTGVAI